ncbi:MAG: YceI family protein [Myxococcales bacterium]|nr:YceI family protein [Myxococcales bacterium]
MKMFSSLLLITALAVSPACKKKEAAPTPTPVTEGSGSAAAGSAAAGSAVAEGSAAAGSAAAGSGTTAVAPDPASDFIAVEAAHAKPKPDDPVTVKFEKFAVTKATFDPKNVEGGTATIELDLASLNSASEKRDAHLKSESYINLSKYTTATIDIGNVKKKDGATYTADAKVKFRDIEKTYPVTFEVVGSTEDSIRVKGEHEFPRADFKVGKDNSDPDESVAGPLKVKLQLTLKKT